MVVHACPPLPCVRRNQRQLDSPPRACAWSGAHPAEPASAVPRKSGLARHAVGKEGAFLFVCWAVFKALVGVRVRVVFITRVRVWLKARVQEREKHFQVMADLSGSTPRLAGVAAWSDWKPCG